MINEIHKDIMPILFGNGLRPFEISSDEHIRLEKIQVIELPARTHIRFRVLKES